MIDVKNIKLNDYFNNIQDSEVLQVSFVHDYFEIWFDKGYLRFMSEVEIKKGNERHMFPSAEANWILHQLIFSKIESVEEGDTKITITSDNGTVLIADKVLEPAGDNFHMKVEDLPTIHI